MSRSTAATFSPKRNVTARSRRWYWSASTISSSQKSSIRVRALDHGHLGAEGGEHGGVLHADHAGADDDHRPRHGLQVDQPSESTIVRSSKSTLSGRAGRVPVAMTILSAVTLAVPPGAVVDPDRVLVVENRPVPADQRDPVAGELVADHVDLAADHVLGAGGQVGDGDVLLDPVALP